MVRVLVLSDADGVSWYRGHGPLLELPDLVTVTHPRDPENVDWVDIMQADVVYIGRAATPEQLSICELVRQCGKPLWLDYDDCLFNMPLSNPCWQEYQGLQHSITGCILQATHVTFSTGVVLDHFTQVCGELPATILPNRAAWPARPWNETSVVAAWRGSATHLRDVDAYAEDIAQHCVNNAIQQFVFFGPPHDHLVERLLGANIGVDVVKPLNLHAYMAKLQETAPKYLHIPLVKSMFNDGKSDIAVLEGLAAGAMPVVYGNPAEFMWTQNADYSSIVKCSQHSNKLKNNKLRTFIEGLQHDNNH